MNIHTEMIITVIVILILILMITVILIKLITTLLIKLFNILKIIFVYMQIINIMLSSGVKVPIELAPYLLPFNALTFSIPDVNAGCYYGTYI